MEKRTKLSYDPSTNEVYKRDLGRVATLWKGDWDPNERYEEMDEVRHGIANWICLEDCMNVEPGTDPQYWAPQVYDGPQGETGIQGADGPQGVQGPMGADSTVEGPQGIQGADGPQGIRGETGSQGATGTQGYTGVQGADGPQGVQGTTGSQGATGAQGYTGSDGMPGPRGEKGPRGDEGPAGAQGFRGAQGYTGEKGDKGDKGDTGAQGKEGSQGYTGAQGYEGAQGQRGVQGAIGSQGATGTQGSDGPQGIRGETGAQGATGSQGATGAQGYDGAQGVQGDNGGHPIILTQAEYDALTIKDPTAIYIISDSEAVQGAQGAVGAQGADGAQGYDGPQGETGSQGYDGPQGADGAQGAPGADGAQGAPGESAVDENAPNVVVFYSDRYTTLTTNWNHVIFKEVYHSDGTHELAVNNTINILPGKNVIVMGTYTDGRYYMSHMAIGNGDGHYWVYFPRHKSTSHGEWNTPFNASGDGVDFTDLNYVIYDDWYCGNSYEAPGNVKMFTADNTGQLDFYSNCADVVLMDIPMNNFRTASTLSALIDYNIYVPKSRYSEFVARLTDLGVDTQYVTPKIQQYDYMVQDDYRFQMITNEAPQVEQVAPEDLPNTFVVYSSQELTMRTEWGVFEDAYIKGSHVDLGVNEVNLFKGRNLVRQHNHVGWCSFDDYAGEVWVHLPAYDTHVDDWPNTPIKNSYSNLDVNLVLPANVGYTVGHGNNFTGTVWNAPNINLPDDMWTNQGDVVFFDATFDNYEKQYESEPSADITPTFYVPKSRYNEFVTKMQALYPNGYQYILNKTVQYDFIAQYGYRYKMITLPTA